MTPLSRGLLRPPRTHKCEHLAPNQPARRNHVMINETARLKDHFILGMANDCGISASFREASTTTKSYSLVIREPYKATPSGSLGCLDRSRLTPIIHESLTNLSILRAPATPDGARAPGVARRTT
jgi:hypothetical protein